MALTNLQENPKLQPLLPTFSIFLKNLVGFSDENFHVVKRIPRIFNALLRNPNLHVESEVIYLALTIKIFLSNCFLI